MIIIVYFTIKNTQTQLQFCELSMNTFALPLVCASAPPANGEIIFEKTKKFRIAY